MFQSGRTQAILLAAAVLACSTGQLWAADAAPPAPDRAGVSLLKPAEVESLEVYPAKLTLKGGDDTQQMLVTARLAGGGLHDVTSDAAYEASAPKVVRVTSGGRIMALSNGAAEVTVRFGALTAKVLVTAEQTDIDPPINFANQIVPIFTKLGCNSGGCHGKSSGQGGFKLSLLGFEPEFDYTALVKEARGRRLFPAAPGHSLLLLKAAGVLAHGGGRRLEAGSAEYDLVRRWIAIGAPYGKATDPTIAKITVVPEQRVLGRRGKQQLAVHAHYTDGTIVDVTRRTQFESNDLEVAVVDGEALVQALGLPGEAAIMARYQGQVAVCRATVPADGKIPAYEFPARTLVDRHTHRKWQQLNLAPSELCSDEQFIRRVSLDVAGTLPTPQAVRDFVSAQDARKREQLVDRLLESPEYAYYFAGKWADILRVRRLPEAGGVGSLPAASTFAFHGWIVAALAEDKPYDEFVRAILTASGDESRNPPTVWYKKVVRPDQFVDDTAQLFLGLRLNCAQCHHHPYEKWGQDDYWGIAAFFGRIGLKNRTVPGAAPQRSLLSIYSRPDGSVTNKRTNRPAVMKTLDGPPVTVARGDDPRRLLVDWMVDPRNPFFARAVVNRYWAHFLGRGIVNPIDDMRVTNPPANPELLDALARDFVEHQYSLKHLIGTICKSRTYQLSAVPNEFNKHDKQTYARYYPRRLSAEVLYDAVNRVTDSLPAFVDLPQDRFAPRRAIMLPDESFSSYFLTVFGRPQRSTACECERSGEPTLGQALHLLNSNEMEGKLARAGGRADRLAQDRRPDAEKVEELFYWALGHKPAPEQLAQALRHLAQHEKDKKAAYESIIWALLNTTEFLFNQ